MYEILGGHIRAQNIWKVVVMVGEAMIAKFEESIMLHILVNRYRIKLWVEFIVRTNRWTVKFRINEQLILPISVKWLWSGFSLLFCTRECCCYWRPIPVTRAWMWTIVLSRWYRRNPSGARLNIIRCRLWCRTTCRCRQKAPRLRLPQMSAKAP